MYIYELLSEYFHESIIFTIGNLEDVVYLQRIPTIPRNFSNLETFSFSQSTLQLVSLKEALNYVSECYWPREILTVVMI